MRCPRCDEELGGAITCSRGRAPTSTDLEAVDAFALELHRRAGCRPKIPHGLEEALVLAWRSWDRWPGYENTTRTLCDLLADLAACTGRTELELRLEILRRRAALGHYWGADEAIASLFRELEGAS